MLSARTTRHISETTRVSFSSGDLEVAMTDYYYKQNYGPSYRPEGALLTVLLNDAPLRDLEEDICLVVTIETEE